MKWWQVVLASLLGALIGAAAFYAVLWFALIKPVFGWLIEWWTTGMDKAITPLSAAISTVNYNFLWISATVIVLAGVVALCGIWYEVRQQRMNRNIKIRP